MNNRIDNQVDEHDKKLHKTCKVEVLAFVTNIEYENSTVLTLSHKIMAKFRDYNEAVDYAEKLAQGNVYYEKIIIRIN